MLRCKEGDLALVIRDEPGCRANLGRVVAVSGPVRTDDQCGPTWLIQPLQGDEWAIAWCGGVVFETPPLRMVEHPDKWLLPLRPPQREDDVAAAAPVRARQETEELGR